MRLVTRVRVSRPALDSCAAARFRRPRASADPRLKFALLGGFKFRKERMLAVKMNDTYLELVEGDITELEVDAIVNPTTPDLEVLEGLGLNLSVEQVMGWLKMNA